MAVARSLINQPSVLLADEPTGALDRKNSDQLIDLLKQLNEEKSLTLLMVTHSKNSADQMKQSYQLDEGKLLRKIMTFWRIMRRNLLLSSAGIMLVLS